MRGFRVSITQRLQRERDGGVRGSKGESGMVYSSMSFECVFIFSQTCKRTSTLRVDWMRRVLFAPAAPSSALYYFTCVFHSRVDILCNLSLRALFQPQELGDRFFLTLTAILKPARLCAWNFQSSVRSMKFATTHSSVNRYGALVAFGNGKNYDIKSKKWPNNTARALLPTSHCLLHGSWWTKKELLHQQL